MKNVSHRGLLDAASLASAGTLPKATALLRRVLQGKAAPQATARPQLQDALHETLRNVLDQAGRGGFQLPGGGPTHPSPTSATVAVPDGAKFLAATFSSPGRKPPLQALCAQRLPRSARSPDRHAARLHPIA